MKPPAIRDTESERQLGEQDKCSRAHRFRPRAGEHDRDADTIMVLGRKDGRHGTHDELGNARGFTSTQQSTNGALIMAANHIKKKKQLS